jgi:mannose-6-phosphate isomerase-like protein (cupin superfamily)
VYVDRESRRPVAELPAALQRALEPLRVNLPWRVHEIRAPARRCHRLHRRRRCPDSRTRAAPGIKRTILHRMDVVGRARSRHRDREIPPAWPRAATTHFGPESGVVLEGSSSLEIEGETPRLLKEGDSYAILAGKVHDAKAVGDKPVKVLATYIVEKGKGLRHAGEVASARAG